jgi:ADYC domain
MRSCLALGVMWASAALSAASSAQPSLEHIRAAGTEFRISLSDGRVLLGAQLIGAVLSIIDRNGDPQAVRIDAIEPDPTDPDQEIQLHTLSVQDPATGSWSNFCAPGPDGIAKAFPLSGTWTADGRHMPDENAFALICTGGAIGKCVRWGYKPWRSGPDGVALWDYHQACVRMVRADYGGDGVGHTRDNTPVDVFDRLGILKPAPDPGRLSFEAAWGVNGAVCVRKPRIAEIASLPELEQRYPRLHDRTGETCREDRTGAGILILNRS